MQPTIKQINGAIELAELAEKLCPEDPLGVLIGFAAGQLVQHGMTDEEIHEWIRIQTSVAIGAARAASAAMASAGSS